MARVVRAPGRCFGSPMDSAKAGHSCSRAGAGASGARAFLRPDSRSSFQEAGGGCGCRRTGPRLRGGGSLRFAAPAIDVTVLSRTGPRRGTAFTRQAPAGGGPAARQPAGTQAGRVRVLPEDPVRGDGAICRSLIAPFVLRTALGDWRQSAKTPVAACDWRTARGGWGTAVGRFRVRSRRQTVQADPHAPGIRPDQGSRRPHSPAVPCVRGRGAPSRSGDRGTRWSLACGGGEGSRASAPPPQKAVRCARRL